MIFTTLLTSQHRISILVSQHSHLDLPNVQNKADPEAQELSKLTDTEAVPSIIEASAEQLNCERK